MPWDKILFSVWWYLQTLENHVLFYAFVNTNLRLVRGTYEDIEVPVLQMHETLDESIPIDAASDLSTRLADSRFVSIDGSDHHVHIDAPDRWTEEVGTFVESLPR